jgi:CRP/FNR family transcriptional regulator, anaerobic regulatory protein
MQLCEDKETKLPCTRCASRALNVCAPLSNESLRGVLVRGGPKNWRKRDVLFRGGDPATVFFKIRKGAVAVSRLVADGRRQIVAVRMVGDCIGYLSEDGRYAFEGQALTDVEVCVFDRSKFDKLSNERTDLAAATNATLAGALKQAGQAMLMLGRLRSAERVAYFLAELDAMSRERFGVSETLPLFMNRAEIADYLGLTIETVSRSIGKLKKKGLITLIDSSEVLVIDREKLCAFGKYGR